MAPRRKLSAGRKPTPVPDASHLQTSSWWVRGAKIATLKTMKAYTDLVTYLLSFMMPGAYSSWVLRDLAGVIVYVYLWNLRYMDFTKSLAVLTAFTAHAAASKYLQKQLYLEQTEEQRIETMKAMYRDFRANTSRA
jgi:hypothetical protein